ncbi:MAG: RNase III inhibitor, partial [Solobacterium sp.]|nr:RNase III inhibitor [Solobacterium sp.]
KEDTFQRKLFEWIDSTGQTDPEVYKRADMDRKLFAKIRKDENYKPSRKTAIALALALRLSLKDAEDLLERAGFALSQSTKTDLIIRYCFEHEIYDLVEVNAILFQFDQELL